eukprot:UN25938
MDTYKHQQFKEHQNLYPQFTKVSEWSLRWVTGVFLFSYGCRTFPVRYICYSVGRDWEKSVTWQVKLFHQVCN